MSDGDYQTIKEEEGYPLFVISDLDDEEFDIALLKQLEEDMYELFIFDKEV